MLMDNILKLSAEELGFVLEGILLKNSADTSICCGRKFQIISVRIWKCAATVVVRHYNQPCQNDHIDESAPYIKIVICISCRTLFEME